MNRKFCVLVILMALFIISCSKSDEETEEPEKTYEAVGVVYSLDEEAGSIIISHEEIPGLMGAMTMRFAVKNKSDLDGLQPHYKIKFIISMGEGEYVASDIQRIVN